MTTYTLIILCELGDKTQVAVLLLASNNPVKRWIVLLASAIALSLCVLIEVTVGVYLAKFIGPAIINRAVGVVFLVIGLFILAGHFGLNKKLLPKSQETAKRTCQVKAEAKN
ncbi:MAG: TMEM165/GDT1 family protein [Eubacteriales bacterium]